MVCKVDSCDWKASTKTAGYCAAHHKRLCDKGSVLEHIPVRRKNFGSLEERFWARVESGPNGCWDWTGAIDTDGYGLMRDKGRTIKVHVLSLFINCNETASLEKPCVLHSCHRARCVNPNHLRFGTVKENNQDTMEAGHVSRNEKGCYETKPR